MINQHCFFSIFYILQYYFYFPYVMRLTSFRVSTKKHFSIFHHQACRLIPRKKGTAYNSTALSQNRSNFDMILLCLPPHTEVGNQLSQHPEEEASFVLKGQPAFEFDKESITLQEGDAIRVLSNRRHRVRNEQDQECVIICTRNRILN